MSDASTIAEMVDFYLARLAMKLRTTDADMIEIGEFAKDDVARLARTAQRQASERVALAGVSGFQRHRGAGGTCPRRAAPATAAADPNPVED